MFDILFKAKRCGSKYFLNMRLFWAILWTLWVNVWRESEERWSKKVFIISERKPSVGWLRIWKKNLWLPGLCSAALVAARRRLQPSFLPAFTAPWWIGQAWLMAREGPYGGVMDTIIFFFSNSNIEVGSLYIFRAYNNRVVVQYIWMKGFFG